MHKTWTIKNKEMRRVLTVLIRAFRKAGFGKDKLCNNVICFDDPEIKIILKNVNKEDINPEIIIRFWR